MHLDAFKCVFGKIWQTNTHANTYSAIAAKVSTPTTWKLEPASLTVLRGILQLHVFSVQQNRARPPGEQLRWMRCATKMSTSIFASACS